MSAPAVPSRSFDTLNALRGIAAVVVVIWHYPGISAQENYWAGYLAVDLFFLLSGVVIAHAYEAKLQAGWHAWRFILARIIRLWPLYLLGTGIGVGVTCLAALYDGNPLWMFKARLRDAVLALFMVPKLADASVVFPYNPPAWSLCCEFIVNIFYGIIGYRLSNRAIALVAALALGATLWGGIAWLSLDAGLNLGATPVHMWIGIARAFFAFPVGVITYRLWRAGRLPRIVIPPVLLVSAFLLALLVVPYGGSARLAVATVIIALLWPLIVGAAIQVEPRGMLLMLATRLAALSYPLYVIHDALYIGTGLFVARVAVTPWPVHVAGAVLSVVLADLAIRYFDSPVRTVLSHRFDMPRTVSNAAPPL